MRLIFDYAGGLVEAARSVYGVNGREIGLCDGLSCVHNTLQFLTLLDRAVIICDASL